MSDPGSPGKQLDQLHDNGFVLIPETVDDELLDKTRTYVEHALAAPDEARAYAPGTFTNSGDHPELADLIGNPRAFTALERMGLSDIKFWKAVIVSKPPDGSRLYWHQDCIMWSDPRAYCDRPPMLQLMYYLDDTAPENGCLRMLPGTHRRRHALHGVDEEHATEDNRMNDPDDPGWRYYPGEVDVPVTAGDLIVGDARLFHAAHANNSLQVRNLITIFIHPFFGDLQASTQSWMHMDMHHMHDDWPPEAKAKVLAITPEYRGAAEPMVLNRTPDARLG